MLQGLVDETVISPKDGRVRFYGYEEPRLTTLMQEYRLEESLGYTVWSGAMHLRVARQCADLLNSGSKSQSSEVSAAASLKSGAIRSPCYPLTL